MKTYKYLFLFAIFLSSCAVYKPDSGSLSTPDYNQRVQVSNAHYDKVLTPIGVGSFFVGTAAGGYLGYKASENSNYFAEYKGSKKQNLSIAGGVLGVFTGYTLTYLLNKAVGWGDYKSSTNPNEWIKKANKNFLLVRQNDNSNFMVIHNSAETNFLAKNMQDARDFHTVFSKNSANVNDICKQSLSNNFTRSDYFEMLNLFPNNNHELDMHNKILETSYNLSQCIEVKNKFPKFTTQTEKKAKDFVLTTNDLSWFKTEFPTSIYADDIVTRLLNNLSRENLPELVQIYPDLNSSNKVKEKYIYQSNTFEDAYSAVNKYPNVIQNDDDFLANKINKLSQVSAFTNKYSRTNDNLTKVFTNLINSATWTEIPTIINNMSYMDSTLKANAFNKYLQKLTEQFNACNSASDYSNYLANYQNLPDPKNFLPLAQENYKVLSASSISEFAELVRLYPNRKNEFDSKVYNMTSNTDSYSCKEYLNYFSDGNYTNEVNDRLSAAFRYEENERIRREEQRRREEIARQERERERAEYERKRREENIINFNECSSECAVKSLEYDYYNEGYDEDHYKLELKNGDTYDIVYDRQSKGWEIEIWGFNDTGFDNATEVAREVVKRCIIECARNNDIDEDELDLD